MDLNQIKLFSASSANDHENTHLWLKGASLFIPQINQLLDILTDYKLEIIDVMHFFQNDCNKLGNILEMNKSDKSTTHNYHIMYSHIFNQLGIDSSLNILEIGLGTNNPSLISNMGIHGRPGASLFAFKEYLPNSNIYGADIDKDILFESERIKTCFVDQLDIDSFENLKTFGNIKYDLIIDDGLHAIASNFNTLLFALNNINENGWIVIEDIQYENNWKSIDFIIKNTKKYKTFFIKSLKAYLYVIHKI